jgi:hypothetical protein
MDKQFAGFERPRQNWSKLPHALIESLPEFSSKAELVVVLYILRHTWGFSEFAKPKKITLDEFQNGRKRKDGSRLDSGVGMSKTSIINGLRAAVENGFVEVVEDDSDAARKRRYYSLRMASDVQKLDSDVQKLDIGGTEVVHRTEKDTIENKPIERQLPAAARKSHTLEWDSLQEQLMNAPYNLADVQAAQCIAAQVKKGHPPEYTRAVLAQFDEINHKLDSPVGWLISNLQNYPDKARAIYKQREEKGGKPEPTKADYEEMRESIS